MQMHFFTGHDFYAWLTLCNPNTPVVLDLRKFHTEQMFVLVSMQLRVEHNRAHAHTCIEAFQALQGLCNIYTILN